MIAADLDMGRIKGIGEEAVETRAEPALLK